MVSPSKHLELYCSRFIVGAAFSCSFQHRISVCLCEWVELYSKVFLLFMRKILQVKQISKLRRLCSWKCTQSRLVFWSVESANACATYPIPLPPRQEDRSWEIKGCVYLPKRVKQKYCTLIQTLIVQLNRPSQQFFSLGNHTFPIPSTPKFYHSHDCGDL